MGFSPARIEIIRKTRAGTDIRILLNNSRLFYGTKGME